MMALGSFPSLTSLTRNKFTGFPEMFFSPKHSPESEEAGLACDTLPLPPVRASGSWMQGRACRVCTQRPGA